MAIPASLVPASRSLERGGAAALVGAAVLLAYANSLRAPFVYDDLLSIVENPTIRRLGAIPEVLDPPPGGLTVSGRPVLNLSLAINYAISGPAFWSYHVFNILVHAGSAMLAFGIVRRTVHALHDKAPERVPVAGARAGATRTPPRAAAPTSLALAVAAIWALHPIQTQAVTYIVQRAESLMGFFFLLTLYAFKRTVAVGNARSHRGWTVLSVGACLLGMGTKEVMATCPLLVLLVLLYDRTFVAGSFRAALPVASTTPRSPRPGLRSRR